MSFWWCLALLLVFRQVCFLEGGNYVQPYMMLPNTPAVSRLAVHDEILPNQLSSGVSSAMERLEVQQKWPTPHSKDLKSVVMLEGERK